jgi:DNA-binding NarL/FixJ family response regulator
LSEAQDAVARAAAEGFTVQQIAERLGISPNTVKFHLKRTYASLGVTNRLELRRALKSNDFAWIDRP